MATQKSEQEHLDETIEVLETSIEKESKTGASPKINSWIKTLNEKEGFKTIVNDLEKLKEAIADKDGKKIYTLLEKLGEATVSKAEKAKTGESASIKKLGQALIKGSAFVKKLVGEEKE
ncbi:hypothetical protein [Pedobacter mucosus]|uniref:hypothetical protein n=1 Tax=Pedobacter mucosus TaxID=2895286 RepID=UPI001EE48A59|nr:hypothetical protein [Pedobacter mucosus]UKT63949.1 hypothetical protein LOK61_19535 [Pedobacter mucosus]